MSNTAFRTSSTNPITNQPPSSSLVILRSDSASESTTVTVFGTVAGVPDTEALAVAGRLEKVSTDAFTAIVQGSAGTTPSGNILAYSSGTSAIGDITALLNPSDGATITIGLTGNTQVYRFKTTLASAYDVQIGADATATMLSFKRAINADGTEGTDYFTGTLASPYLSATVATTVMTVTDRVACNRQLAWTFTESASNFANRVPKDGVDGTLLFSLSPTVDTAATSLLFSTEDRLTDTLPALMTATSVTVSVGGGRSSYRIYNELAIKVTFQSSTDQIHWTNTAEGELTLSADTTTFANFTLPTEFLRMKVTENLNTAASVVDARVIY